MRALMIASAAISAVLIFTVTSEARGKRPARVSVEVSLLRKLVTENEAIRRELAEIKTRLRPDPVVASAEPGEMPALPNLLLPKPMIPDMPAGTFKSYADIIAKSAKLNDLVPVLRDKVAEILTACPGVRLTSGYRPGARVLGSGKPSLHSQYPSKAADLQGDDACMMRHLAGWRGGLSIDPLAVRHRHLSYAPGSREFGSRFAHYRPSHRLRHTRIAAMPGRQVSISNRHAIY